MTPVSKTLDAGLFGKHPPGTLPALCEADSTYPEKSGDWCFAKCPKGFEAHDGRCWTACEGRFPADDEGLMCGASPQALQMAHTEMIATTVRSALVSGMSIGSMILGGGIDGNALGATIQAFADLGKPFARPVCPEPTP